MNKLLITGCLLATAFAAVAMPNKKELAAVQKRVEDVIAPDVKALNAGRKTVKDVADIQMKLAVDAQSEAEKYLLLQSAFKLYSRGEEFDSAAAALMAITRDIKDVPPELITELVDKEFNRDIGLKAPKEIEVVESRITDGGAKVINGKATVDGYTWSYRVNNGEAEIVAEKDGKFSCAVSPRPTGKFVIPAVLGGAKVTSIGKEAFKGCHELTSLTMSGSVMDIGNAAFYHCSNLGSVRLPQGLVSIGANAFMGCRKLAPVTIPLSVTNIGEAAFAYCLEMKHIDVEVGNQVFTSIDGVVYTKDRAELVVCPSGKTAVTIPESVTIIRGGSFTGGEGLTSLTIPPTVKTIGEWAFSGCGLTSVILPPELTCIEVATFWGCGKLTSVTIPESVTQIRSNAFRWCGKLTSITIPKFVRTIEREAFYECGGLMSVAMRGSCPSVQNDAFKGCGKLAEIRVPMNLLRWSRMKSSKETLQGIPIVFDAGLNPGLSNSKVPEDDANPSFDKATVNGYTWSYRVNNGEATIMAEKDGCVVSPNPTGHLTIPSTLGGVKVTSIGDRAFPWCDKLTSVTLPESVTRIGRSAFSCCRDLASVTMCGERPDSQKNVFYICRNLKSIHVPANAKSWAGMKEWQGIPLVFDEEAKDVPEMTPVEREFKIGVAPGTVTALKLSDDCEIEFVYCPAGEFTMGYKNMPQVTRYRTIRITHPFWMSKTPITDRQLDALNVSLSRRSPDGYGRVDTVQIPAFIAPTALGKKFGGRLPCDYVFRLPTEAEFEYVLKAEAKEGDPRLEWAFADKEDSLLHPWGVKGLWRDKMCLFDRYPPSGQDVVHRIARNVTWTDLLKINYDNQPQENPLGWSDDPKWKPLRWPKLGGHGLHGTAFFLVVAPDPASLNKFIWK